MSIVARHSGNNPVSPLESKYRIYIVESTGTSGYPKNQSADIPRTPGFVALKINRIYFGIGSSDTYAIYGHLGHSLSLFATLRHFILVQISSSLLGLLPKNQVHRWWARVVSVIYATPSQLRWFATGAKPSDLVEC